MNPLPLPHPFFLCLVLATVPASGVTIDGIRDPGEYETELAVQQTATNWGSGNYLANLHAKEESGNLNLHLAGRANGNAVFVFIDSKAGGLNYVPNNAVLSGGEGYTLNNLGTSTTSGMTFEAGFAPDFVVRIYGSGADAHVNAYNLATGVRVYAGNSGPAQVSRGFIALLRTVWADSASSNYPTASSGVEMALSLAALGVPQGSHTVKIMAILLNGDSTYGSNQVLGSRLNTADIAGARNTINFETEAGTQTLSFSVSFTDTDGDGLDDDVDPDDDNDGLPDVVETNSGTFVNASNTGTDPKKADTDEDNLPDGEEVNGTSVLGFPSNPLVPNHVAMAVAGDFTSPQWRPDGSAGNLMTRAGTSLEAQVAWSLRYRFPSAGAALRYKFAANYTWSRNWGAGATAGVAEPGAGNINASIVASGFHDFSFNTQTLTHGLTRTVFATEAAFLLAYGLEDDPNGDADFDTVSNRAEFTANTDPTAADTDGDTLPDATDPAPLTPNSTTPYDAWAQASGLSGANSSRDADPDGDGYANLNEYMFGTSPTTPTGSPTQLHPQSNTLTISWLQRQTGAVYTLQTSATLVDPPWATSAESPVRSADQSNVPAGYERWEAVFNLSPPAKLFVRVRGVEE